MNKNNNNATQASIVIFWLYNGQPSAQGFQGSDIGEALACCEDLRRRGGAGEPISHVVMSTDNPNNVTKPGVSDKLPDGYDWMKRRRPYVPGREPASA